MFYNKTIYKKYKYNKYKIRKKINKKCQRLPKWKKCV